MVMMAGMELPAKAIREQISSAIDIIVHQSRFRDGSRKVVNISEVLGMEGDTVTIQDLFVFKQGHLLGVAAGRVPATRTYTTAAAGTRSPSTGSPSSSGRA